MTKRFAWIALFTMSLSACAPNLKDLKPTLGAVDTGFLWFSSADTLVRTADGTRLIPGGPIALSGDLQFPPGNGPFPAVVLAHGCGGVGNAESRWAQALRDWGYATFVIDSFRGRQLTEVCSNARALTGAQRIPDAFGALRFLATHPKIDARRVALMGFSHGGILTVGAATNWAKERYATSGQPAFRAFLPFYPYCNIAYPESDRISAPMRIHTGELDNWTPAAPCSRLVEALRSSGQDATITIYRGAHHSFDNVGVQLLELRTVDNGAGCDLRSASILGPLLTPGELPRCMRKGATIGWSPEATEQARRNVQAQLVELLK